MEPATMITGAAIFILGFVVGRINRSKKTKQPKPICSCSHALSYHDRDTSKCHASWSEQMYSSRDGDHIVEFKCGCQRYVGPEHLTDVWAPPIITKE